MMIFMVDTLIYMYQCMYVCTTFSREGSYYLPIKAIQFAFDRLYDKQNLTRIIISYQIYKTRLSSFNKLHMSPIMQDHVYIIILSHRDNSGIIKLDSDQIYMPCCWTL